MKNKAVFGILPTQSDAERLISDLQLKGFSLLDISVLLPNKGATRDFAHAQGTKAPEGAVAGGGAGGVAGGVLGLLVGLGALAIPGLGPLLAAGPVMAALSGIAVGAAVGSMTGALIGLGIPEIQAKAYDTKIQGGNVLVAVHTVDASQVERAKEVFVAHKVQDIAVTAEVDAPDWQDSPVSLAGKQPGIHPTPIL
jgi:hypothetical protein